jgi:hypothetical protein
MHRLVTSVLSVCLVSFLSAIVTADIAPPPSIQKGENVVWANVIIKADALKGDDAGAKAKIIIPRSMLPAAAEKPVMFEQGPAGGTIIAGISLSLAAVSLVWLRRSKSSQQTLMLVIGGLLLLTGIGALYADLAPPGRQVRPRPRAAAKPQIVIQLADDGEAVTLIVPR